MVDITLQSLKMLVKGQVGVKDMSGPVGVVDMIGETYTESVQISWFAVFVNMLNHCNPSVSQSGCHESSAIAGTGWRSSGVPDTGIDPWQTYQSGKRRYGTFYWTDGIDGAYGSDPVQRCDEINVRHQQSVCVKTHQAFFE